MWDLVIIGAGMAGLSTAIWARRLGLSALVLEQADRPGGQLTAIGGRIPDYPGVDLPNGAALTEQLLHQAAGAGVELRLDTPVQAIDCTALTCQTADGLVTGRALVLATGIARRHLAVPGEAELYQRRLIRRPSHDLAWFAGRRVAVIGGGDRAAENALLLAPVAERVLLLHRGDRLRARPEFTAELEHQARVEVHLQAAVDHFQLDGERVAIGLGSGGTLQVDAVCIYIGNRPNSDLVVGQLALDPDGYLLTDRRGRCSLPGVYAVGDLCTPPAFQSLSTAAGQAMVAAKQIALDLAT